MKASFLFILLITSIFAKDFIQRQLKYQWKMKVTASPQKAAINILNKEFNVSVPSTLHLNLQKYKQIPDPFMGNNIQSLSWVSNCQTQFWRIIVITQEEKSFSKIKIIFEGIDTYSEIYFNQQLLGSTKNAFLKYEFYVQKYAKVGQNKLRVKINSTKQYDSMGQRNDRMPFEYAHTRKACYQYSWDWAPYMNTVGIWLPVFIYFYNDIKIDYIWIRNKAITEEKAILDIVLALDQIQTFIPANDRVSLKINLQHEIIHKQELRIKSKYSHSQITIQNPKLWWPNNIGQPYVYLFKFQLFKDGDKVDEKKMVYGIRTVQLDDKGPNFKIIVNGYPIYCKGANYVPPDMMYPRLINKDFNPRNTFQNLLEDAASSNFNMLRVWGGGQYEVDQFYELASRKGIMIFQDFMFSDSIYPGTDDFQNNVRAQVVFQVRRLRNHPCLVLWSGNNQILQGIQSWGWGQTRYVTNYQKIFKNLIPSILNIESKDLPYIQSSPSKGVGNGGFAKGGDVHFWGVWAAAAPFDNYQSAVGGFNSEFGTQSLPAWRSILQFTREGERKYDAPAFISHERHSSQFRTLINYMSRYSQKSINFQLQAYSSGLVQAFAIQTAIRAQRIAKPKSFGTLYWQFNDAWPSISWSSIDYYGRWKPLQFMAKRLYKDIILFYHPFTKKVSAINDKLYPISTYYTIIVFTFEGKVLFKSQAKLQLQANDIKVVATIPDAAIIAEQRKSFIYTEIIYGPHYDNKTILTTFTNDFKNIDLEDAELNIKFLNAEGSIQFSSNYLIKSLFIDSSKNIKLSDNYFDVVPGHPIKVKVQGENSLKSIKDTFTFKSYRQIYDPKPLRIKLIK